MQVDDEFGTAAVFVDVELTDEVRRVLKPILEPLTDEELGYLLATLVRRFADEQAYERVCRGRGLLL